MKAMIQSIVLLCLIKSLLLSQDTAIVKYLPLKVGNVWVYNWTASSGQQYGQVRIQITSTIQSNGIPITQLNRKEHRVHALSKLTPLFYMT